MEEYEFGWFNELLCLVLQWVYFQLKAGKSPRLMIFAPPRSGKSELASRRFPSWVFGMEPKYKVIACSYAASLANDMSTDTKSIMCSPEYNEVFPNTHVPGGIIKNVSNATNKVEKWQIIDKNGKKTKGQYIGAGVGGPISGKGFNLGIVDDPVKDYAQAASKAYQERVIKWWNTTFYTRRDPKLNAIILIMTRWHKMDLAGYLEEQEENGSPVKWLKVKFPMVAEEKEYFEFDGVRYNTREFGELLHPERMPPEFVEECKTDDLTWSALYQQRPNLAGGNFFKVDYFPRYEVMPKFERMIITGDTAQKTKEANDFSVFQCWGLLKGNIYLVDLLRGKWEAHILKKKAWEFWDKWGGGIVGPSVKASAMYVEDKVSGTGLIQELRAGGCDVDGVHHNPVPVIGIPRGVDKITRAIDAQPSIASGFVHLPENAPWMNAFTMEIEDFNLEMTHANDDQIDPMLDAIDILIKGGGGVDYSKFN
jgi:predicted phage terminase large subunit-like protein